MGDLFIVGSPRERLDTFLGNCAKADGEAGPTQRRTLAVTGDYLS